MGCEHEIKPLEKLQLSLLSQFIDHLDSKLVLITQLQFGKKQEEVLLCFTNSDLEVPLILHTYGPSLYYVCMYFGLYSCDLFKNKT